MRRIPCLEGWLFVLVLALAGCAGTSAHPAPPHPSASGGRGTPTDPVIYLADRQLVRSLPVEQVEAIQDGTQRWAFALPASGDALVVAGGTVYVGTTDTLFALDAASGHKRWAAPAGPRIASIVVVSGLVYVDSGGGGAAGQEVIDAFDASDGSLRWHFTTASLGISTWLVDNGVVYILEAGFPSQLVALDAVAGTTRWQASFQQDTIDGQVNALLAAGPTSLLIVADQSLLLVQKNDGAVMWRRDNTHNLGLQIFDETIYSFFVDRPTSFSGTDTVGLRALNVSDGSVLWEQPLPASDGTYRGYQKHLTVGAITSEAAYLVDGPNFSDVHAWDLTGKLLWAVPGSDTYRELVANDQAVFVASAHGMTALAVTTGTTHWHDDTPADVATMEVGTGGLYAINASNTKLYTLEPESGKLLWTLQANQIYAVAP